MKRLLIPLLASISLSPIIQADQRNEAIKINSKNYSELCNSAKSLEYADEMMSWYPSYKYFKKSYSSFAYFISIFSYDDWPLVSC